jgi:ring-1,2-phenylacetyl-CoA epoxidase subunit PaaB
VKGDTQWPLWEVFVQEEDGSAHVHAGSVHAPGRELALQNARDVYARRGRFASIWVVESSSIAATAPADRPSFFDPAVDKIYRHPQFYKVPRGVKGL